MPQCNTCQNDLPLESFELTQNGDNRRRKCKQCRRTGRNETVAGAANVEARQEPIPPERCEVCNNPPSNKHVFELRTDRVRGPAYRTTCNRCRNEVKRQRRLARANVDAGDAGRQVNST